ncbi:MAG TPA: carboxypeptidase regulatory-like domain-containing protein, partial [Terriglobia bacterium]|nr:carboxypeptidase regulatory-like domain-containing protein [Terriglobia bacterium]
FLFGCDGCDFFAAMDRLSFETGSFWTVTDAGVIVVATDNPTVRRDVEDMIVKAIYFSNGKTSGQITEAVTALRIMLSFNQIGMSAAANAIVLRDTADKIGLAEKIIAVFDPQATFSASISSGVFANAMDRDARRSRLPTQLQLSSAGPLSVRFNQPPREAFATVAGLAGIRAEFHPQLANSPPLPFQVDGADWVTAMDTLAFQTGTFWIPRAPQTVLVGTDNPTVRRDVIPEETKTIPLRNINSPASVTEVSAMLRTLVAPREVQDAANAVVVNGFPDVIALSERIVALVDIAGRTPTVPTPRPPTTSAGPQPPGGAGPRGGPNSSVRPGAFPTPPGAGAPPGPIPFGPDLEPGFGSIAGQVRLNDGSPAVGVRVSAVALPSGRVESITAKTDTDVSGRFKLENVPSGRYALRVDSALFPYPTYFPSAVSAQEGEVITVTARGAVEGLSVSTSDVLPLGRFTCMDNASCFDFQRRIVVEGVMKQFFVQGPALKAVLSIRGELGPLDFDVSGPNAAILNEKGFSQVKAGDRVKVILSPRRDSGPGAFLAGFVKADGAEVSFGVPTGAPAPADAAGDTIRINFQPSGAPPPAGYLVDTGSVFGDRGNGYRYGWAQQNSNGQDRKSPNAPDRRYDTLAHLQWSGSDHVWELEVPNGFYSVRLVAGDPSFFNSFHLFSVEGVIAVNRIASSANLWIEDTVRVAVNDGRLTIANASGACNNKLAFIEVTPVTWGPEPAAAAAAPAFVSSEPAPASLEGRSVIAGFVRTPSGAPVPGVRVASMSVDSPTGASSLFGIAQTDETGRYVIEDIPDGRYFVVAGSLTMPLYHPGVGTSAGATIIAMSGKPVTGINFSADAARFSLVCSNGTGPKL